MIIDFHTHIFPGPVRSRREEFFHGESAFKLLYESPKSRLAGAAEIVETMDEQGIDVSVVFGFPGATKRRSRCKTIIFWNPSRAIQTA